MIKHLLTLCTIGFGALFGEIVPVHIHYEGQVATREYDNQSSVDLLKNDIYELFRLEPEHQHIIVREFYGRDWIVTKGRFYDYGIFNETRVEVSYCEPIAPYEVLLHLRFVNEKLPAFDMQISSEMTVDELKQEIRKSTGLPTIYLTVKDGRNCCALGPLENGFQIKDYLLKTIDEAIIWTPEDLDD